MRRDGDEATGRSERCGGVEPDRRRSAGRAAAVLGIATAAGLIAGARFNAEQWGYVLLRPELLVDPGQMQDPWVLPLMLKPREGCWMFVPGAAEHVAAALEPALPGSRRHLTERMLWALAALGHDVLARTSTRASPWPLPGDLGLGSHLDWHLCSGRAPLNLSGYLVMFGTEDGLRVFVTLSGAMIRDDHYPYYEFLLRRSESGEPEILASTKIFYDVAGMEGFEGGVSLAFFGGAGLLLGAAGLAAAALLRRRAGARPFG